MHFHTSTCMHVCVCPQRALSNARHCRPLRVQLKQSTKPILKNNDSHITCEMVKNAFGYDYHINERTHIMKEEIKHVTKVARVFASPFADFHVLCSMINRYHSHNVLRI